LKTLETEFYQKTKLPQMNKEWFLVTLNSIGDAVIATDTEGYVTFMNPVAQNLTGWEQKDALGKPLKNIFNIINEETGKKIESPVSKVLREGKIVGLANHTFLISKNGMKIPIDNNGAPIKDEKGNIIGVVLVFRNITERKLIEKVLKESKERFEDLYENAPDGYYSLDGNGIIIEANNTLLEMFEYKKEELRGKHTSILFSDETKDEFDKSFSRLKEEGLIDQEVKFVKKDGEVVYVRFRGIAKQNEDKLNLEYKCAVRDITKRKQAENKLKILYELGKKITSMISKEELLPWIGEQATKLLDADTCNYRIREGDYLIRGGGSKVGMELMKKERLRIGESLSGWIAKEKKPLIIPDGYSDDPRLIPEHREIAAEYGFRSALGVPMCIDGKVVGVLVVVSKKKREFTQTDVELLSSFSDQAAIALDKVRLFENLEKDLIVRKQVEKELHYSMEKLRKAMSGIVHTMAMTVEAKDPYTAGHQRRVSDLARSIAKEMNLPEQQIDAIRMAGTIHDLGKISVPGEILSKPGKINETEFDLIKDHAQVGYDILKEIEFPWPIAKIVLQHHERMDGSGYPSGLSGEDITMEARILAVADVVEAMAFHRPYRPALGIKKALDEISQKKDILYDSKVADACLKLFNEKGFKFG